MTPPEYRVHYEIYPAKACIRETADLCNRCITGRIQNIGRDIGKGPGPSPNMRRKGRSKGPSLERLDPADRPRGLGRSR
jgi:hypothetical protein